MNNEIIRIGKIEIYGTWAPELLATITPLLTEIEPDLPPWCDIAHATYDMTLNCNATCGVDFRYRRIRFCFGPYFFQLTDVEREKIFYHEFMHSYAHHLYCVAYDIVEDFGENNEMGKRQAHKALKEANEGITTDLTTLFMRLKEKKT